MGAGSGQIALSDARTREKRDGRVLSNPAVIARAKLAATSSA
jgi:hypothetical protein